MKIKGRRSARYVSLLTAILVIASLVAVAAPTPVAAAVSGVTVSVSPITAGAVAQYTVVFTTGAALAQGGTISVDFGDSTAANGTGTEVTKTNTYATGDVTLQGVDVTGANVAGDTTADSVTITLSSPINAVTEVILVFKTSAALTNPTPAGVSGTYKAWVNTSAVGDTTPVASAAYTIQKLATVTNVQPVKGNVGDTMWVEVTGTAFTGTDTTNASTTTLDFGAGVTVVSTKYVSDISIDVKITVSATGTKTVSATTTAGTSTTNGTFTANAANTKQVDVWVKYTPDTDTIFDSETLVFDATTLTITAGIAEATAGTQADPQVLIVHASTYTNEAPGGQPLEGLYVDKNYVTIKSLSGAASTIINASGANFGVTLAGKRPTIENLTISRGGTLGGDSAVRLSQVNVDLVSETFTIKGNTFSDWNSTPVVEAVIGGNNYGRISTNSAITSAVIQGNTFTGNSGEAIRLETDGGTIDGLVIKDNTMTGNLTATQRGIILAGVGIGGNTRAVVEGNTISNMGGKGLTFFSTATGSKAAVTGNTISGNSVGIDTTAGWDLKVYKNSITNNTANGIAIADGNQGTKTFEYNNISGNSGATVYGLTNADTDDTITAKYNWWGAIGGPAPGGTAAARGNGDKISANVTYDPWLTEQYATVISSGIRSYGSDAIVLGEGWNTLSVPVGLKTSADTIGEVATLGTYLVASGDSANYAGGYWYDTANGLWVGIDSSTALVPGKGYYIKMTADSRFPVLYFDGSLYLPSYLMSPGWNLIGSMFGIDTDFGVATANNVDGGTDDKDVAVALASIATPASVVISPSLPGQTLAWSVIDISTDQNMIVGEAYWVYMGSSGTLAGFEVTPYYFVWAAP